jgi:FdhD protein
VTGRARVDAVTRLDAAGSRTDSDLVAIEAPLEVLLTQPPHTSPRSLGLLMRTPGDDRDLVLGLLYAEGVIDELADVLDVQIARRDAGGGDAADCARVALAPHLDLADRLPGRALSGTSACGLCGKLSLRAVDRGRSVRPDAPRIAASVIAALPATLLAGQAVFAGTGGLHGAALCDLTGAAWLLREDVGRHNAVDKIVGAALAAGRLPAHDALLAVSGRVAYEIVQKAVAAGVAAIVAVGAPSSLAVDAARATHLTLVGFARDGRFNVYAGAERIDS